jgi:pyruvate dehydrogenase E2 component (dihydrolipoamide acetyltransferase)
VRAAAEGNTSNPGLSPTRRTIAQRMVHSLRNTAPVTLHTTVDATNLVEFRRAMKAATQTEEAHLPAYTDMLMKLVAAALKQHPSLNARWEGDHFIASSAIHIGMAVDTDTGLLVPVIRDVPRLSLSELAARSRELIERARARRLAAEELRDGTFTLTNLGIFDIDAFTPIINYPECAILGMGRIQRRPVVVGSQIVPRDLLTLSLTFDHRAVDGAPAARFLQTLRRLVESPAAHLSS